MPRSYVKGIGKRPYAYYSQETLQKALLAVRKGLTLRKAEEKYGVSRSTLNRHIHNKNTGKYGRPAVFSQDEELLIVNCIAAAGDWGFPLTKYDIRCLVKSHLDRKGLVESRFKNNFPGADWIESFVKRHSERLTTRLSQNIKRARAAVDENIINDFFDELDKTLDNIEPPLIVNYDETNLCDDPKRQRVVVRRSCRHPEKILDSSKSSTSVMFAAAGDGKILPIFVNYKAEHLYNTWTTGGPSGTVYNRTKSGWFTMETFEDWFKKIALPYFRQFDKEKNKALIGDNLASHVSPWVIEKCIKENIRFILLPPNSTGLCQPLDVAFFKPLKTKWSQTLTNWKLKNRGVVPKDTFPRLLKKCLEEMAEKTPDNIKAGFRGSGLVPLDRNQVLKRLPKSALVTDDSTQKEWVESFTEFLKESRAKETAPKKKRLNIKPGASVTEGEIIHADINNNKKQKRRKCNARKSNKGNDSETDTDATVSLRDSDDDVDFQEIDYLDEKTDEEVLLLDENREMREDENKEPEKDGKSATLSRRESDCYIDFIDVNEDMDHEIDPDVSILSKRMSNPLEYTSNINESMPSTSVTNVPSFLMPCQSNVAAKVPNVSVDEISPPKQDQSPHKHDLAVNKTDYKKGDFIIVKFFYNAGTKKAVEKRFVGKGIDAVSESHVFVKFLRKSSKVENTFIFPHVDDEQLVAPENIVMKIDPLNISRGRHLFPKIIKEYSCS